MLNLIFQKAKAKDPKTVRVDSRDFFSIEKKVEWFQDPFVQQIIREVDHAECEEGFVLRNEEGIAIPPEYLSTGAKTAICVYEFPELIFNATQMGDNALNFVLQLSLERDITLLVYRVLPYDSFRDLDVYKDYKKIEFEDWLDFCTKVDEWLEEIYND